MAKALYIYNLFPLLYPDVQAWTDDVERIAGMGFNSIFLNPFHLPGRSGSLYAVADYYRYNPRFFPDPVHAEDDFCRFLQRCQVFGLDIIMDLVANHTAIDSPLVTEHQEWYTLTDAGAVMHPFAMDNGHPVVWDDLAKLDYLGSRDRAGLWRYMADVCRHYLRLGVAGFRCDAAYQVDSAFWRFLLVGMQREFPRALFLAETLGCSLDDTRRLAGDGFDYIFNSFKWWNLRDGWCPLNYAYTRELAPSISFPETHDTARLMAEVQGNEAAFLLHLYASLFFSKGCMIVSGLEAGCTRQPHVVYTTPGDWERGSGRDYSAQIRQALRIKEQLIPLHEEGPMELIPTDNPLVTCLLRENAGQRVMLLMNTDTVWEQPVHLESVERILQAGDIVDLSPARRLHQGITSWSATLLPGEVKIFASETALVEYAGEKE